MRPITLVLMGSKPEGGILERYAHAPEAIRAKGIKYCDIFL